MVQTSPTAQRQGSTHPPSTMEVNKNFIGSVQDEWQMYSDNADDYKIDASIGFGASSIVYAAVYQPRSLNQVLSPIPCALKVLDLDSLSPRALALLQRETTLMSLSKHPNVLRVRGSWVDGHKLHIALRLMNSGSVADVMRYGWPGGMEEDVVRCILNQALQGLNYLHINGFIHRDIKAANLLVDDDGTVLLGDLGVAADLTEDTSSHRPTSRALHMSIHHESTKYVAFQPPTPVTPRPKIGKRKSFVGTPCWMAPEIIQGKQYDSSADIWSFGITALELAQGRPPRSRESPQRVLLRIIQEAPPTLDREGGAYKYSKAFKEMVESCLNKDPSKRPTAEQLLQSPFFKAAKKKNYLVNAILKDLPPLVQRQERRALNHNHTARSIDSWDFSATIQPSGSQLYRRKISSDNVVLEVPDLGVFEMEEDINSRMHIQSQIREVNLTDQPFDTRRLSHEGSSSVGDPSPISSIPLCSKAPDLTPASSVAESPSVMGRAVSQVAKPPSDLGSLGDSPPPVSHQAPKERGLWNKLKTAAKRSHSRSFAMHRSECNDELIRTPSTSLDRIGQKVLSSAKKRGISLG